VEFLDAHEIKLVDDDAQCLYMDTAAADADLRPVGTRACSGDVREEWKYIAAIDLLFVEDGSFFQISNLNFEDVQGRSSSDSSTHMKVYLGTAIYADFTIKGVDANDVQKCMAHKAGNTGELKWVDCADSGVLTFSAHEK